MRPSLAVIIPVRNAEETLRKTVKSVQTSLQYFADTLLGENVRTKIVIVDDCSTDDSFRSAKSLAGAGKEIKVLQTERNRGPGAARNLGVKAAATELLCFCDADDLYFENHIYTCFQIMSEDPRADAVKTGVYTADTIHPHFQKVIQTSLPLNLCVKRSCHEFVEGFPEDDAYLQLRGGEDTSYILAIGYCFRFVFTDTLTVEYVRRPGNAFDRQLRKFQRAPGTVPDSRSREERSAEKAVAKLRAAHLANLKRKRADQ